MNRIGLQVPYISIPPTPMSYSTPSRGRCLHSAVIYVDEFGIPRCSGCRVERSRHVQLSARLGIPTWQARLLAAAIDVDRWAARHRAVLRIRLMSGWCMWWLADDDDAWADRRVIAGIAHRAARGRP